MKAIISVLSGDRIDYHSTEIFEKTEIEEICRTKSLTEKRLHSVIETLKLKHKDYDLGQITKIMVTIVDNGFKNEYSCDKSLEYIKEISGIKEGDQ